jgi:hypothetical protein
MAGTHTRHEMRRGLVASLVVGCAALGGSCLHREQAAVVRGPVSSIAVGRDRLCMLRDARVLCYGVGNGAGERPPTEVPLRGTPVAIGCGSSWCAALDTLGVVWGWEDPSFPTRLSAIVSSALSVGPESACLIARDGGVSCLRVRRNVGGRAIDYREAFKATGWQDATAVVSGRLFECAVVARRLRCGIATLHDGPVDAPVELALPESAVTVRVSGHHVWVVSADGALHCEVLRAVDPALIPVDLAGATRLLAASERVVCRVDGRGSVGCWEVADALSSAGCSVAHERPIDLDGAATAIAVGDGLACAVSGDNTISCWSVPGTTSSAWGMARPASEFFHSPGSSIDGAHSRVVPPA